MVYDGVGLFSAPRVWWTFRTFGVRDVFILDGGMPKWKAEGRPIDFGEVKRTPRHFTARFNRGAVADASTTYKRRSRIPTCRSSMREVPDASRARHPNRGRG